MAKPKKLFREICSGIGALAVAPEASLLSVFGDNACALATVPGCCGADFAIVAVASYGDGRACALGHPAYLTPELLAAADTEPLLLNVIRWLGGDRPGLRVAVQSDYRLAPWLAAHGYAPEPARTKQLSGVDLLICDGGALPINSIPAVQRFVREGGGVICAGQAPAWPGHHGDSVASGFPGNGLFADMGIVWSPARHRGARSTVSLAPPNRLVHVPDALALAEAAVAGKEPAAEKAAQAAATLVLADRSLPGSDTAIGARLRAMASFDAVPFLPTVAAPMTRSPFIPYLAVAGTTLEAARVRAETMLPHPAAKQFPGDVPADAPRLGPRPVAIDPTIPRWQSTGLYAAPGERITVRVSRGAVSAGLQLRIGCHDHALWHADRWARCPVVTRAFPIQSTVVRAACAFGGLIYVEVPETCRLRRLQVAVENAVAAPRYVFGETNLLHWRKTIRHAPAPWAELASDRVILTVPSEAIRKLADPERVMRVWNRIFDACAELAGLPDARTGPERLVCDPQPDDPAECRSYPMPCPVESAEAMVDPKRLLEDGETAWELFRGAFRCHLQPGWGSAGPTETLGDLFALFILDTVCHVPPGRPQRTRPKQRRRMLKEFFALPPEARRQKEPATFLTMYLQLQEAFGWAPFRAAFAESAAAPDDAADGSPCDRERWQHALSRAAGHDLAPFFSLWSEEASTKPEKRVAPLPPWIPKALKRAAGR